MNLRYSDHSQSYESQQKYWNSLFSIKFFMEFPLFSIKFFYLKQQVIFYFLVISINFIHFILLKTVKLIDLSSSNGDIRILLNQSFESHQKHWISLVFNQILLLKQLVIFYFLVISINFIHFILLKTVKLMDLSSSNGDIRILLNQ